MTRGQRLAAVMTLGAAVLLLGRGAAVLYADHAWYEALGAASVWDAKVRNTIIVYALTLLVGFAFAFVNLLAVRQSIVALILPARVGSLDIGAEVPTAKLIAICTAVSLFAAGVGTFAAPSWTTLALWRSDVTFGESDPYFGLDLSALRGVVATAVCHVRMGVCGLCRRHSCCARPVQF